MEKLNIYSFHRKIASHRFDAHNTKNMIKLLSDRYDVTHHNLDGDDGYVYENDCNVIINQGSIVIFEFDDTKKFKTFDFGDAPTLTLQLSKSKNFIGAAIGQYNPFLWDRYIDNSELRQKIKPSIYPETCWNFGIENYNDISEYRKSIELDTRLYWRGSVYRNPNMIEFNRRLAIQILNSKLDTFYFGDGPLSFDDYIKEAIQFKLCLGFGVGGGYVCGDFCLRDIEMYGMGIPTIRPKYAVQTDDPLIPDYHYISVDCEFDETFRYTNPELLADSIVKRYREVIDDTDYLNYISSNAREWYVKNVSGPNISKKIIDILEL
jgi:hypothetical protein